jgi:hypothetical protein
MCDDRKISQFREFNDSIPTVNYMLTKRELRRNSCYYLVQNIGYTVSPEE